jgi:hypothetical protein
MNWTCDETRRHLLRQDELSEAALEHLAHCAVCQEMMDLPSAIELESGSNANAGAMDVASLLSQTQLQLSRERGLLAWLRSRQTPLRLALAVSVALLPAAAQLAFSRRHDLGDYPLPRLLLAVGMYLAIAILATRTLLSPLYRPRSSGALASAAALAFSLPFILATLAPAYAQPASHVEIQHSVLYHAWVCLRYGTLLSFPAVLLFVAMDRQVARGRLFLTLTASIGGVAGNFALLLHCPNGQLAHQLLGHATVGLVLLFCIGAAIVFARVRSRNTPGSPTGGRS